MRDFAVRAERPLRYCLELAQVRLQPLDIPALAAGTLVLGAVSGMLAAKLPLQIVLMTMVGLAVLFAAFSLMS